MSMLTSTSRRVIIWGVGALSQRIGSRAVVVLAALTKYLAVEAESGAGSITQLLKRNEQK